MRRLLICLIALAVLPGCTGSGGSRLFDPFSKTTVEPPRTGWILGQPASDPYYSHTGQAGLSIPAPPDSGWTANAATASSGGPAPRFHPGSDDRSSAAVGETLASAPPPPAKPGDRVAIPVAARDAPPPSSSLADRGWGEPSPAAERHHAGALPGTAGAASSAVAPTVPRSSASNPGASLAGGPDVAGRLAGRDQVTGTIQPGARGSASPYGGFPRRTPTSAEPESRRLDGSPPLIDIMDLPPTRSTGHSGPRRNSGQVRFASATEEVGEPAAASTQESGSNTTTRRVSDRGSSSPRARYAHDPQYRWMRGRLEYSQTAGRWKLRYIPVGGETDEFGGSVVLANPSQLSGYERGQFVEVQGRLGRTPEADAEGYAPEFEISSIRRLGN